MNPSTAIATVERTQLANTSGAASDGQLVELWLQGRSEHTRRAYAADVGRFLAYVAKPLHTASVADVSGFAVSLTGSGSTRCRALSAVKSLLTFGQRTGYLTFNVGAAIKLPRSKGTLAQRILAEPDVQRMLALEPGARNRVLLRLLYAAGLRVSELCGLTVADLQARDDGGQITVFGKGSKRARCCCPLPCGPSLPLSSPAASRPSPCLPAASMAGSSTPRQCTVSCAARPSGQASPATCRRTGSDTRTPRTHSIAAPLLT